VEKIQNALLLSAATMVAGTYIAYLVYNDGESQGFGNREVLMKCVSGNLKL
jgi:phage-related tail fiber protein